MNPQSERKTSLKDDVFQTDKISYGALLHYQLAPLDRIGEKKTVKFGRELANGQFIYPIWKEVYDGRRHFNWELIHQGDEEGRESIVSRKANSSRLPVN